FWPRPIVSVSLRDGRTLLGEVTRSERYRVAPEDLARQPDEVRRGLEDEGGWSRRLLLRTGNYDLTGEDFVWVPQHEVIEESLPADAWLVERREWGPAVGFVRGIQEEGRPVVTGQEAVRADLP